MAMAIPLTLSSARPAVAVTLISFDDSLHEPVRVADDSAIPRRVVEARRLDGSIVKLEPLEFNNETALESNFEAGDFMVRVRYLNNDKLIVPNETGN